MFTDSFAVIALIINLFLLFAIITFFSLSFKALRKYLRSDDKATIIDIDTAVKSSPEKGVFLEYIQNHKEEIQSLLDIDIDSKDIKDE